MNFQLILSFIAAYLIAISSGFHNDPILMTKQTGDRIVAGRAAYPGEIPHQLSLHLRGRHNCGASLVRLQNIQFGITAAHCVTERKIKDFWVVAGETDFAQYSGLEQIRKLNKLVIHPNYTLSDTQIKDDLALLFFRKEFRENLYVRTVSLPVEGQMAGGILKVSGWGKVKGGGMSPYRLQVAEMPVVQQDECGMRWSDNPQPVEIGDGILCAGLLETSGLQYPCHGDSGGPAVTDQGRGYLAGVVSFVDPSCRQTRYPAGFTKVSEYMTWIKNEVAKYALNKK